MLILAAIASVFCAQIFAQRIAPSNDYVKCYSCNGAGKQKCTMCMGMGGSGNGMYYRACAYCRGAGVVKCGSCGGYGAVRYNNDEEECTLKIASSEEVGSDDYYSTGKTKAKSNSGGSTNGYYVGGGYNSGYGSGSSVSSGSSSSSTYTTCKTCGGTGRCTTCNNAGGSWEYTGYYTGENTRTWITCPSCNNLKRCYMCLGRGKY